MSRSISSRYPRVFCDDFCNNSNIAFYKDGTVTVLQSGFAGAVNAGGTVGGSVTNDNNLIVITAVFNTHTSYLVPTPGVRLNLADLVENLPVGQDLFFITDMNNTGDMIGFSSDVSLRRRSFPAGAIPDKRLPPPTPARRHAVSRASA
jgi:hypothetical protein